MAPQLDTAQRILIRTLLTKGFETSLIASKASCTVRVVQRIRLERQQSYSYERNRFPRLNSYSQTLNSSPNRSYNLASLVNSIAQLF